MNFCTKKILNAIWLFALLLNAFSFAVFAETSKNPAEMVYCPLTKKLQPIKAQTKEVSPQNPLQEICAVEKNKESFSDEISRKNLFRINLLDEKQFENLAFDYFQKRNLVFQNLPPIPDSPKKNSVKTFSAVIAFNQTNDVGFIWKLQSENFSFAQNPRPPNSQTAIKFDFQIVRNLEKISHNINPRSPPFFI